MALHAGLDTDVRSGFLANEDLKGNVRREKCLQRTERNKCQPLDGRNDQRGTAIVAKALPQPRAAEGWQCVAMHFAKAMRLEQAGEGDRMEVREVRRGKAALPHAVERSVETEAAKQPRKPEENALAVWQDQNQVASGREALEARRGGFTWRRKVFEDVMKADDVENLPIRKVLRKETRYDRKSVEPRLSCDSWIRFQADGAIASVRSGLQEPPVSAADVQETARTWNR